MAREVLDLIPHLQALGIGVVVEIDDHFHALAQSNPAWEQTHPDRDPDYHRDILTEACRIADLVTCSTRLLSRVYAPHGRVEVIPNYARAGWLDLPTTGGPWIGWTGTIATHQGDLATVAGVFPDALPDGWGFQGIGSDRTRDVLRIPPDRFMSRPWLDLTSDEYPMAVGSFGVGIVPLAKTQFNDAKSWLKGLEYAALGVPFVASPAADYRNLGRLLTVPLARNRDEWKRELGKLTTNPDWRATVAGVNRDRVRQRLTIEGNAERWMDAWTRAARRRKAVAGLTATR